MSIWTPLFSFAIFMLIYGVGSAISYKTKGLFSAALVLCIVYLIGFWTDVIPADSVTSTQMPTILSSIGLALLITNLGTMIPLRDFLKEWKTVVVALFGLVGLAIGSFTISTWLFGKTYALAAASPLSGGIIAGIITNAYASAAGHPEIGGFAMLLVGFQIFVGLPVSSFLLKKEASRIVSVGVDTLPARADSSSAQKRMLIPQLPPSFQNESIYLAKLAFVGVIAYLISQLTIIPDSNPVNYYLNPNIAYLIFGILFTEIGFLERNSLSKAGCNTFLMLALVSILPSSLATITPQLFLEMMVPILGTLIIGAAVIMVFSAIIGKPFGYSPRLSMAIGLTALVGYPCTQLITEDIVNRLDCSEEEREKIMNYLLPKMLIGGFTTVTIASVVFAGLVAPLIFK